MKISERQTPGSTLYTQNSLSPGDWGGKMGIAVGGEGVCRFGLSGVWRYVF